MSKQGYIDAKVAVAYEIHDDGDISTEQLLQRICDETGYDIDVVIESLKRTLYEKN